MPSPPSDETEVGAFEPELNLPAFHDFDGLTWPYSGRIQRLMPIVLRLVIVQNRHDPVRSW